MQIKMKHKIRLIKILYLLGLESIEQYYGIDLEETGLVDSVKASTDFVCGQKPTEHQSIAINKLTKLIFS